MKGKLYGIGVGPGDPDLITVKAKKILEKTNLIAVPKTAVDKDSLALKIVRDIVGSQKEIIYLEFPMSNDSKVLKDSWNTAANAVSQKLTQGLDVAFITLGDPTVYSTYIYLHKLIVSRGFDAEIIPGVTSFCASACKAGISLAEGKEGIAIIPSACEDDMLSKIIDAFDNIVLMKASKYMKNLGILLKDKGLDKNAVVINNCGLENESVDYNIESENSQNLGYFTTVIVKKSGVK